MTSSFVIFVDGTPVAAAAGQTTLDAIVAWRPDVAESLSTDLRMLTDSRGLPADPAAPAYAGAIFRVVSSRQLRSANDSSSE
mgnify:FL=1